MCKQPGWFALAVFFSALTAVSGCGKSPAEPNTGEYALVFEDNFDGNTLNLANWAYDNDVHVNNEQQQYASDNVQVGNGLLRLILRLESRNGYPFTSGRIYTKGRHEFTYGRMVARMRLPTGEGFWPAFWMLGYDIDAVGWPACGEIDVMENIGYQDWVSVALHGPGYSGGESVGNRFATATPVDSWHEYRVDWNADAVEWFIDDQSVLRVEKAGVPGKWVFDHPFYLILNLALGGDYPYAYNHVSTPYRGIPQSTVDSIAAGGGAVEIDWVRVYQQR